MNRHSLPLLANEPHHVYAKHIAAASAAAPASRTCRRTTS